MSDVEKEYADAYSKEIMGYMIKEVQERIWIFMKIIKVEREINYFKIGGIEKWT